MMDTETLRRRFEEAVDAWGGALSLYPDHARAAVEAMRAVEPGLVDRRLAEAARLDAELAALAGPAPSIALEEAILRDAYAAQDALPKKASPRRGLGIGWLFGPAPALAGAAVAGFVFGFVWIGPGYHAAGAETVLAEVFDGQAETLYALAEDAG